jgi:hypothetical protein
MMFGAGLLSAGLIASSDPADAATPTLALDRSAVADTLVEKAGYYYRPRRYYRPYAYGYRPYYRPYYRRYYRYNY